MLAHNKEFQHSRSIHVYQDFSLKCSLLRPKVARQGCSVDEKPALNAMLLGVLLILIIITQARVCIIVKIE